jgi:hypothetical protein
MKKSHKRKVATRRYKKFCFFFGKTIREEITKELDNEMIIMLKDIASKQSP